MMRGMTPHRRGLVVAASCIGAGYQLLAAERTLGALVDLPEVAARVAMIAACACQALGLLAVAGARCARRVSGALPDLLDSVVVAVVLSTWVRRELTGTSAVLPTEGPALGPAALTAGCAVAGLCLWLLLRPGGPATATLRVGPSARQSLVLAAAVSLPAGAALGGARPAVVVAWAVAVLVLCLVRTHLAPRAQAAVQRGLAGVPVGVQR